MNQIVILDDTATAPAGDDSVQLRSRRLLVALAVAALVAAVGSWSWSTLRPQPQFVPPEAIVLQEVDGVLYIRQPDGSFIDVALPGDPLYTFDDQGALFEADEGWLIPIRSRGVVSLVLAPYDGSSARSVLQLDPPSGSADDSGGYHLGDDFFAVHRSQQVEVYDLSLDLQHEVDLVGSFDGFAGDGQLILESLPDGVTIVRRTFGGQEVVRARLSSEVLFAGGSVAWVARSDVGATPPERCFTPMPKARSTR